LQSGDSLTVAVDVTEHPNAPKKARGMVFQQEKAAHGEIAGYVLNLLS
jgi:hypothetical protein